MVYLSPPLHYGANCRPIVHPKVQVSESYGCHRFDRLLHSMAFGCLLFPYFWHCFKHKLLSHRTKIHHVCVALLRHIKVPLSCQHAVHDCIVVAMASPRACRTCGGVYLAFTGPQFIHVVGVLVCGLASLLDVFAHGIFPNSLLNSLWS